MTPRPALARQRHPAGARRPHSIPALAVLRTALLAAPLGCSSSGEDPPSSLSGTSGQAGAGGSGAGQAGAAGAAGQGGGGAAGSAGAGGVPLGGGGGAAGAGAGGAFQQCATGSAEAKPRPVDLYVMLDRSGSMVGPKWSAVTSGLSDFFAAPGTTELRLGLQFFPLDGAQVCDFKAYSAPAVPVGALPGNAAALQEALGKQTPGGETPTLPALQGAYEQARGLALADPERAVALLLATDDEPNVCASTLDKVAQVAQNARTTEPSIATFVIGVGDLSKLDAVAEAGGTSKAFLVDGSGASTKEQFVQALGEIRDALVVCSFPLPALEGKQIDPGKVNVLLTAAGGGEGQPLYKSDTLASCAADGLGWYYEPPEAPAQVTLCPAACAALKGSPGARLDLVFGCASLIK